jgi:hypothetical protein
VEPHARRVEVAFAVEAERDDLGLRLALDPIGPRAVRVEHAEAVIRDRRCELALLARDAFDRSEAFEVRRARIVPFEADAATLQLAAQE